MSYTYLSQQERYRIGVYREQGLSSSMIAGRLSRHQSTIVREVNRDSLSAEVYRRSTRSSRPWELTDTMRKEGRDCRAPTGCTEENPLRHIPCRSASGTRR